MSWQFFNTDGSLVSASAGASGPSQANQAALEAETNEDTYAPPDLIKHSPGIAKVWLKWESNGAHSILASYNMASVTDGGAAGIADHLWDVDFSGSVIGAMTGMAQNDFVLTFEDSEAAGGVTTRTQNTTGAGQDASHNWLIVWGDQ